ncbi:uncharacterized protein znf512 [Synchiropus splendidus]|uniref:uncharacterized protein znf512 n=1 Tax=Synchiropus splendidus TaxID=270530 RepID=UPI00237E6E71|nr:uncharacterized protein znf512 [Synchiropus splendidus]XP_053736350.1 uncharacterized protein znf512 [Synchiropus splendidus]
MSPLYVPRRRKVVQHHSKVFQQMPEASCDLNPVGFMKTEESVSRDSHELNQNCDGKRYGELQSVSMKTADLPVICSVMTSSGLANGTELVPASDRLSPPLVVKEVWSQNPDSGWTSGRGSEAWEPVRDGRQELWNSGRARAGHEPAWVQGRESSALDQTWSPHEQGWASDRDVGEDVWHSGRGSAPHQSTTAPGQMWGSDLGPGVEWSSESGDRGNVWRPEMNMKKVEQVQMQPRAFHSHPDRRDSRSGGLTNISQPSTSQLDLKPLIFSVKKEPPSYPPGSEEERWQLQITAKGRVSCPKCKSVSRKTVEGLKKHMENCRLEPYTCPHCGKQLKSSTGMKYHIMADHSHLPTADDARELDERAIKEKLRKILKKLGKLKCSKEGCSAAFTSIMGYLYHMRKCGKEESELEKLLLNCSHCGKTYRSKAGLEYHLKSEHAPTTLKLEEDQVQKSLDEAKLERTASGRVQRASAQVANFHLAEIASNELPKDWPKRKFQSDLVPDDKKLKYSRPGLPSFSQEVLRKWKNEVKLQKKVHCPNQGCGSTYTSVSGLKAHLGLCTKGDFEAGKYRCLICSKEFNSESGVKYHINSVHSQDWFVTNKKASKKFEQFLKSQSKLVHHMDKQVVNQYHYHHFQQHHHHHYHHHHYHHLQQHAALLQPDQQDLLMEEQPAALHYTQLEPPPGHMWVEAGAEEMMEKPGIGMIKVEVGGDGDDSFCFGGSGVEHDKRRLEDWGLESDVVEVQVELENDPIDS